MKNLYYTIYSGEQVMRIAGCTRPNLANWLRRGLLENLSSSKKFGKHRKFCGLDIVAITAMEKLSRLGIKPSVTTQQIVERISQNAKRLSSAKGQTGITFDYLSKWLLLYYDNNTKTLEHLTVLGPEDDEVSQKSDAVILINCEKILNYVLQELEQLET